MAGASRRMNTIRINIIAICKLWAMHEYFRTAVVGHQIPHNLWQDEVSHSKYFKQI